MSVASGIVYTAPDGTEAIFRDSLSVCWLLLLPMMMMMMQRSD